MLRLLIAGTLGLMLVAVSCGGQAVLTGPEGTPFQGPIRVQPAIVDIATGDGVPTAITIELEDGSRLHLRLGESINLDDWDLEHLDGHRRTSTTLFVTYEERPSEFVVIELSE
ncbi:MAG: hypothetical protein IH958_03800 [Chloroflexi bacterium]|nr:hypothetical protein [Chloroflexota bacterium]